MGIVGVEQPFLARGNLVVKSKSFYPELHIPILGIYSKELNRYVYKGKSVLFIAENEKKKYLETT